MQLGKLLGRGGVCCGLARRLRLMRLALWRWKLNSNNIKTCQIDMHDL